MPVSRAELLQMVRARAPQVKPQYSVGDVEGVEAARPVSAALGRVSAARREASTVSKCYELFISEGTDPEVALHAARAHAVTMRQNADAARRRISGGGRVVPLAAGMPFTAEMLPLAVGPPAEEPSRPQTVATAGSRRTSNSSHGARPSSSHGGAGPSDPLRPFGYMTLGPIAAGAFSTVVRAKHLETSKEVAVKTFLHKVKGGRRPDMDAVRKELECLQCLKKSAHENVANLIDVHEGQYETHAILVCCAGGTLARYMQTLGHGKGLDEQICAPLLVQVGNALAHMHEIGVTHRDVKTGNVVFDDNKRETVRLVDFGFAKLHKKTNAEGKTEVRKLKTLCGSPAYMAPELNSGKAYLGPPVDVWALGCLAFELLHNKPAYRAQSIPELNARIMKRRHEEYHKSCSTQIRGIIDKMWNVCAPERASAKSVVENLCAVYDPPDPDPVMRVGNPRDWG